MSGGARKLHCAGAVRTVNGYAEHFRTLSSVSSLVCQRANVRKRARTAKLAMSRRTLKPASTGKKEESQTSGGEWRELEEVVVRQVAMSTPPSCLDAYVNPAYIPIRVPGPTAIDGRRRQDRPPTATCVLFPTTTAPNGRIFLGARPFFINAAGTLSAASRIGAPFLSLRFPTMDSQSPRSGYSYLKRRI